MLFKKREGNIG
jgi:hypothetical protein